MRGISPCKGLSRSNDPVVHFRHQHVQPFWPLQRANSPLSSLRIHHKHASAHLSSFGLRCGISPSLPEAMCSNTRSQVQRVTASCELRTTVITAISSSRDFPINCVCA